MTSRNLLGTVLFVIAIAFGVGVFWRQVEVVRTVSTERSAKIALAAAKTQRLSSLQVLRGAFAQQTARVDKLLTVLPSEPQVPELLVTIEAMGKQNSITLQSLVPQIDARNQKVELTIVGEGDLAGVEKLAQAIADNDRPLSIDSVVLNRGASSSRLSFSIAVSAPYVQTPTDKGASL